MKNIFIALLVLTLWAGVANAQALTTTSIPVKVTLTWNDAAHTPITGMTLYCQQDIDGQGLNWFQFCNNDVDSTGTAAFNFLFNPLYANSFRFFLINTADGTTQWCDPSNQCAVYIGGFDPSFVAFMAATATPNGGPVKPLAATVEFSNADYELTGFIFNP